MDLLGYPIEQLGPWAFIIYIVVKELIPKLFPDIMKLLDKRISTEDRLFTILEKNAETNKALQNAIEGLSGTLLRMDARLTDIENVLGDSASKAFFKWYSELPKAKPVDESIT